MGAGLHSNTFFVHQEPQLKIKKFAMFKQVVPNENASQSQLRFQI